MRTKNVGDDKRSHRGTMMPLGCSGGRAYLMPASRSFQILWSSTVARTSRRQ